MVAKHASLGILGKVTKMDASGKLNVNHAAEPASNSKKSIVPVFEMKQFLACLRENRNSNLQNFLSK